ncbi:UNVERIFIED_ORG: hypothetical protein B2H93_16040 [Clostridium botulinum]
MFNKNNKTSKEHMITTYIKGAIKLELKSDSGKINFSTFLGAMIFAFVFTLPDGVLEIGKTLYSMFKLNSIYEAKVNFVPLYIAVICGFLCFVLMGFVFEKQNSLKQQIEEVKVNDEIKKQ